MKTGILLVLGALFISIANVFAQTVEIDGIKYNLNPSIGTAEVSENNFQYSGDMIIPSGFTYEGRNYAVTSIGSKAFAYCSSLTSVVIPNSVVNIMNYAFEETSLSTINIPHGVTNIEYRAFSNSNIDTIIIPNGVPSIEEATFWACGSLSSVTIPSNVQQIKESAFYRCYELSSVKNLCLIPVDISSHTYVFWNVEIPGCTLTVPTSSVTAYQNAPIWQDFNIVGGGLLVNPSANNNLWGFTEGNDLYASGANATVKATPRVGCSFLNWTVNGTVVSTETTHSFTVTEDIVLVANFDQSTNTVSVIINNPNYGTVSGAGDYPQLSTAVLTANANYGYKFEKWIKEGEEITNNPYYFTVTGDIELTANFIARPSYTVNLTVNNPDYGSVQGSGVYYEDEYATFYAEANSGYHFVSWLQDGTVVSTNANYTCLITGDMDLIANFAGMQTYTVNLSVNNPEYGSVHGSGTYYEGQLAGFLAVANDGYVFINWQRGDVIVSTSAYYTCTIIENMNLTAYFAVNGIEDNELSEINIYPNPTSGVLRIESGELRIENIEVFNMMGKICKIENMQQNMDNVLDVSYLPAGMYFVRITTENGVVTRKIFKQ